MKNGIPYRNHTPYGWQIASYIERAPNPAPNSRCLVWGNTIILQASDHEAAYEKIVSLATQISSEFEDDTRSG
jgi:hypothetical protein